jgi:hypothetical protein
MYPLHSTWLAEQAQRAYDPDRLDRVPVWARPVPPRRPGARSRVAAKVAGMHAKLVVWARRGALGPVTEAPARGTIGSVRR